eukprot:CAMPEP_0170105436 /NCGR_PEP_ID=MMETSP0020_2-20130122/4764_1 /TAXON_ID=98059 /ORGANISM="Dinobryon sp., Strain UTEXLB2267" /LENGTH=240 /DNA_ID=CAMNT_0010329545 /DNA_START=652 /DNA_END=1374 /DNA_ORIENTATION=-
METQLLEVLEAQRSTSEYVQNLPDITLRMQSSGSFCICGQGFEEDMIACDSMSCMVEWFHFACVGLQKEPEGEWYCPACRGDFFTEPITKNSSTKPGKSRKNHSSTAEVVGGQGSPSKRHRVQHASSPAILTAMVTGSHSDSIVPLDRNHSSSITSSSSSSSSSSSMDDVCACSHGFIDFSTECTRCFGKTKESNHETNQVQVNDYSSSSSIQDQRTSTNRVEISAADSNSVSILLAMNN